MTDAPPNQGPEPKRWLSSGVADIAAASLFSDVGHELATSLLPTFLISTLHAGPATLWRSRASLTPLPGCASWLATR